ncbi:putative Mg2+ transporter-C (MgtC) family protein [Shimia isoporae]|uniref:Protein MgtC n=1 Tax=Shimia isoporae TaxID=647720 RepID=A0A4V2Q3T6_9RHOB|nr:MgtC/SapB family protein [Shimia isoporae]TCL08450.1 putative Mg2+ transporter-C (MgtC) family protein [Shimia isoporae]
MPEWMEPDFLRQANLNIWSAVLCGGLIGAERQLRGKRVGLRVCMLIVLTSAMFVTMAVEIAPDGGNRVLSGIVSGVGFLGAGVIFAQNGRVSGITTATLIWSLAAIGACIGFGYPIAAILATLVIMAILGLVDFLESHLPRLGKEHDDSNSA